MNKKLFTFFLIALSLAFVTACVEPSDSLSAITFTGLTDSEIENGVSFNFLTGVRALGNDGVEYTDEITLSSTSSAVNLQTGALDTTSVGVHAVRYEVVVGDIVARQFRYITVKAPKVAEGEMLVNKDISQGTLGWDDPSVVYIADGAAMTLSAENGQLKAVVVAGANSFTPRFGQMNIPFEQGKTYEVSFDARSTVAKEISLQVGELLPSAPWFNDFLPSAEPFFFRTITTEMARYSYKFTMTQDNQKGGILFGLGTVKGQKVDATLYFDNFAIVESTPDADTTGPLISGVKNQTVPVNGTFNPLTGVTAVDVTDGDVTNQIAVVIKNSLNVVVQTLDLSVEGVYTITYTVEDSLGNKSVATMTLTVEGELPAAGSNLLATTGGDLLGWTLYNEGDGQLALSQVNSKLAIDVTGIGDADYKPHVYQILDALEVGEYTFKLKLDASVARNVRFNVVLPDAGFASIIGGSVNLLTKTDGSLEYELTFSVVNRITNVKIELAFGNLGTGFVSTTGVFTIQDVSFVKEEASDPEWIGYGLTVNQTAGQVAITYANTPTNWWENNAQLAVVGFDGTKTAIQFTYTGVAGQDYLFKVEGGPAGAKYDVEQKVTADGTEQTVVINLSTLTQAQRNGINLIIVFAQTVASSGTITVKDWVYEVVEVTAPVWVGYGLTVNETAGQVAITYANTPTNWWENNAQLAVVGFDGTKTAIKFVYTGVAGQDYLFKVEGGPAGAKYAVEQKVTADGTEQTVVINLSTLTEAQRNGINLIIVFAQTVASSGTLTVKDWVYEVVEVTLAKLPTPVNGFNHTVATNHVGIGPYGGGAGYTGQLRFVWFVKGTETVAGTDLFNAPANVGYAYIYTTYLATLPNGTYTVKFQAVGDGVLALDSDFFGQSFEVVKAAPVELTYTNSNEFVDGTFTTTTTIASEVQTGGADTTGSGFWYSYIADWGGAAATFTVSNGALEINITNSFNQIWGVMLKQKGIDLVQNTSYRLSFTASSTVARDIRVGFAPGTEQKLFSITTTPTTYTFDFTYTGANIETRIEFLLGTGPASTITLDNIELLIGTNPS